jgi:hypothetical protein
MNQAKTELKHTRREKTLILFFDKITDYRYYTATLTNIVPAVTMIATVVWKHDFK